MRNHLRHDEIFAKMFHMSEDQFTKLFKYTRDQFVVLREEMNEMNKRINNMMSVMDHLIESYDILVSEEAAGAAQTSRLSDKIHEHDQEIAKLKKIVKASA